MTTLPRQAPDDRRAFAETPPAMEQEGRRDFLTARRRSAVVELSMTVLTVVVAVLIAFLVVLATGKDAPGAMDALLTGPLDRTPRIGRWLADATTLALLGLSVAIPFRARQISLGAEAQVYTGALAAALVAINLHLPPVIAVLVPLAAAAVVGGALGTVPGVMKARLGANEIVATLMLNAVVVRVFDWLLTDHLKAPSSAAVQSAPIRPDSALPLLTNIFGVPLDQADVGLFGMLAIAAAVWFLLARTPLGYRIRMTGSNPSFARYGGIDVPRTIEWSFVLGGSLAGLAGAHLVLGIYGGLQPDMAGGLAFEGIVVALLARNNPLAVVGAALLYSYLRVGGDVMEQQTDVGSETVIIIQAVIVLLVTARALPDLVKRYLARKGAR
ncbi:ABC transporter permease [Streptomyces ipomoeae]|uniref:ABC transporter permease n=1 Tax=Streptomyces ipomoeae TaxID=103232 RepID=UPI001FD48C33|nr:ABC transporter permease [Streptomyces ipomoeae]MDX2939712.1 ABC transporter permease [Streptomyces ipomoeae]